MKNLKFFTKLTRKFMKQNLALAGLLLTISSNAAIVDFSINQTFRQGSNSPDIPETYVSLGGLDLLRIDPGSSGQYFDFHIPSNGRLASSGILDGYEILGSYNRGQMINSSLFSPEIYNDKWKVILSFDSPAPEWSESNSGIIAFITGTSNYGYINYSFSMLGDVLGEVSELTLLDGAVNTIPGQEISSVPLPAGIYLFLSGLVGLGIQKRISRKG